MRSNNSNGSRAAWARGFMALFAVVLATGLGVRPADGGGALRLCHELYRRHCLGDRHGHQHGHGDDHRRESLWLPDGVAVAPDGPRSMSLMPTMTRSQ